MSKTAQIILIAYENELTNNAADLNSLLMNFGDVFAPACSLDGAYDITVKTLVCESREMSDAIKIVNLIKEDKYPAFLIHFGGTGSSVNLFNNYLDVFIRKIGMSDSVKQYYISTAGINMGPFLDFVKKLFYYVAGMYINTVKDTRTIDALFKIVLKMDIGLSGDLTDLINIYSDLLRIRLTYHMGNDLGYDGTDYGTKEEFQRAAIKAISDMLISLNFDLENGESSPLMQTVLWELRMIQSLFGDVSGAFDDVRAFIGDDSPISFYILSKDELESMSNLFGKFDLDEDDDDQWKKENARARLDDDEDFSIEELENLLKELEISTEDDEGEEYASPRRSYDDEENEEECASPRRSYNDDDFSYEKRNSRQNFSTPSYAENARESFCSPEPEHADVSTVQFSAVAPQKFTRGDYALVDVYMYDDDFSWIVDEAIENADVPSKATTSGYLNASLNTRVKVVLSSKDVEIDDGEIELVWNGKYQRFSFDVYLPDDYSKRKLLITATIYFDGVIATKLKILADCASDEKELDVERINITRAFISYASQDRNTVSMIVQGLKKARPDLEVFFDVESLRSGQRWQNELQKRIGESDVLFLCWSHYAKESHWVDYEWRYAYNLKGEDFIEPIPLEEPANCTPPDELSGKHFNDLMLYIRK